MFIVNNKDCLDSIFKTIMIKNCSICNNKKGKITIDYCPSNPLSSEYKDEPAWEHDGGWEISQMVKCRDFCKKNLIQNDNGL